MAQISKGLASGKQFRTFCIAKSSVKRLSWIISHIPSLHPRIQYSTVKMSGKEAYTPPVLEDGDSNRIYILGPGNIGRLFAHAIAKEPSSPPLTLLVHRTALLKDWEDAGRKLEIITDGQADTTGVFEIEAIDPAVQGTAAESHPVTILLSSTQFPSISASERQSNIIHRKL
jgi:hypothetical protein